MVTKTTHAMIVEVGSLLRVLFIGIARGVKVPKPKRCWNPPNTQINLKTIRSLKWKDPCRGQRHVVATRSGGMFSASCRTTSLLQLKFTWVSLPISTAEVSPTHFNVHRPPEWYWNYSSPHAVLVQSSHEPPILLVRCLFTPPAEASSALPASITL